MSEKLLKYVDSNTNLTLENTYDVKQFHPTLHNIKMRNEKISAKSLVVRVVFTLISKGKFYIYYVLDNNAVVHVSYVMPRCIKFPFLKQDECIIGPCYTFEHYRGKGIYPYVLRYIVKNHGCTGYYIVVSTSNISSFNGVKKAGFDECGNVKISRFLKRYSVI